MELILLSILILLTLINLILVYKNLTQNSQSNNDQQTILYLDKELSRLENSFKNEFNRNRDEIHRNGLESRTELSNSLKGFQESVLQRMMEIANLQKGQLDTFSNQLTSLTRMNEEKLEKMSQIIEARLTNVQEQINNNAKENREEVSKSLKSFEEIFTSDINKFSELQNQKFSELSNKQNELIDKTEAKLDKMREIVEGKLTSLQADNNKQLEKMRETVDEKLHKTLETRLGQSFKMVSDKLEQVHKGLGEMQSLANGVGDLKKVLSNVKTKGVLGEYQLENILEQILTQEQYGKNVKTKEGSNAIVEFAVKLPGRHDNNKAVWLPMDSKFPTEAYHLLIDAYDQGNTVLIEETKKQLANTIKTFAKDIRDKYIDPPNTTDFGIMFLPFEGLYAEVLRLGLFETLQREYKIIITGPTTISALLNSLQMGFKTLAIEKRSSEVWQVLGAVKAEFSKFGEVLEKTQKKLNEASSVIEKAGVRTRAIERKLRDVEELPQEQAMDYLEDNIV
ncbi:DNA recombination protein RmuC [Natranaerovirga pectinivora]|uniref:DNA recombination protein RmuC n=1 Tax=Natranaerovirga pectinivora TaxID=682400 RepID=A0A4R3MU42_9FIRM|nr:DNA recombination protein RmuC [Natranaerovirga pectinivora]TCT16796.1 DNA recombination protein RmuC [Natranaerovirga pectinivora]